MKGKFLIVVCWCVLYSNLGLVRAEPDLHEALNKSNGGDTTQAIHDLENLIQKNPNDAQVALSLGLLYQSTDQDDKAIPMLEKAVQTTPNPHGYFALGLLYESKMVSLNDNSWKPKAINAWEEFLKVAPMNHGHHRAIAEKHLKRLRNQG